MSIIFSCIIPCKDPSTDPYLQDLIDSIRAQDFPQDQIEILVMDPEHGDSEQAKAAGIRQAKGEICAMFCADNFIVEQNLFSRVYTMIHVDESIDACYPWKYAYIKSDNSLNRYFSLIGGNDPISYYLGKNDRIPHIGDLEIRSNYQPSYGCNGFFYRSSAIKATDLDHYYPMDNALEIKGEFFNLVSSAIWHRTSENLISFLKKRYRYARDLYCERKDRRWRMLATREDYLRLAWFIGATILIVPSVCTSIRGFLKIKDLAWFWHWPVCFGFLVTYSLLVFRNLLKHGYLFQCRQQALSSQL